MRVFPQDITIIGIFEEHTVKYTVDNDLHIHSKLSLCSGDIRQTTKRILKYAKQNGLKTVCLTDHFWDENVPCKSPWYAQQNYEHIKKALPLPSDNGIRFLFGCETELEMDMTLGLSKEKFDLFDFIIIPTTHFHMNGYAISEEQAKTPETRAAAWVKRFEAVLNMELPFNKVGLAHLTCRLLYPERAGYLELIRLIPENDMRRLFSKAASLGVGIELNADDMIFSDEEAETVLRPYRTAKECGCKFYLGSDAHHPRELNEARALFEKAVDLLQLEETDKFII